MTNLMNKLILSECPDYDFERQHFVSGDIVKTLDGAVIIVTSSALEYITGYVYRRSLRYTKHCEVSVPYSELPYYKAGEFKSVEYKCQKKIRWSVGDIVQDPTYGAIGYLYEQVGHQQFYMYVLETDNPYYLHTGVYIESPYSGYITVKQD